MSMDTINTLKKRWISTIAVQAIKVDADTGEVLGPKGTWLSFAEIQYLPSGSLKPATDCLLHKKISSLELGEFKVVTQKKEKSCDQQALDHSAIYIDQIHLLKVSFKKDLNLRFTRDGKESSYDFLFFNRLENDKANLEKKKLASNTRKKAYPGLWITNSTTQDSIESITLIENNQICFDVDDKCRTIKKNNCHLCRDGTYEIRASECSSKLQLRCGHSRCGQAGEFACIKHSFNEIRHENYCLKPELFGFCHSGLQVICQKGELYCQ